MIAFVNGVLQDGGAPVVYVQTVQPLAVPLGSDMTVRAQIYHQSGTLQLLSGTGVSSVMTVRKATTDVSYTLATSASFSADFLTGSYAFTSAQLAGLTPGTYFYDVSFVSGGLRDEVVPVSPLFVRAVAGLASGK